MSFVSPGACRRTSKTFCALDPAFQKMRGRSQFFGKRAPSAGSTRHGPPLFVPDPAAPKVDDGSPDGMPFGSMIVEKSLHLLLPEAHMPIPPPPVMSPPPFPPPPLPPPPLPPPPFDDEKGPPSSSLIPCCERAQLA